MWVTRKATEAELSQGEASVGRILMALLPYALWDELHPCWGGSARSHGLCSGWSGLQLGLSCLPSGDWLGRCDPCVTFDLTGKLRAGEDDMELGISCGHRRSMRKRRLPTTTALQCSSDPRGENGVWERGRTRYKG